jgi:hypothetical protein
MAERHPSFMWKRQITEMKKTVKKPSKGRYGQNTNVTEAKASG